MFVIEDGAVETEGAGIGVSMRLLLSLALIWKTTRISNSLSALRLMLAEKKLLFAGGIRLDRDRGERGWGERGTEEE